MPYFAVERYLPGSTDTDRAAEIGRVHTAREQLARLGATLERTLTVPADEMCMHVFRAEREADVIVAFRHARLPYDRIVHVELSEASSPEREEIAPPDG